MMGGAKPAGDGDGKKPKGGLFGSLAPSAKPQNDAISKKKRKADASLELTGQEITEMGPLLATLDGTLPWP